MGNKKNASYVVTIGAALVLIVVIIMHLYMENHSFDAFYDFSSGWEEIGEDGQKMNIILPAHQKKVEGKWYVMSHKLPEDMAYTYACIFKSENVFFEVYCDDTKIYEYKKNNIFAGNSPGDKWNVILLPENAQGKTLTIRTQVIYSQASNFIRHVYIGDYEKIINALIRKNISGFIICILLIVVSAVFILINELIIAKVKKEHTLTVMSLFTIILSIWSLSQTPIMHFLVANTYIIQLMTYVSLPIAAGIMSWLFAGNYKGKVRTLLYGISLLCLVLPLVSVILDLGDLVHFPESILITQTSYAILFVLIIVNNVKTTLLRKKHTASFYIMQTANLFLGAMCFLDLYRGYVYGADDYSRFTRIGLLFFISCIGIDKVFEFWDYMSVIKESEIMRKLAYLDGLTEVGNRTAFNKSMSSIMQEDRKEVGFVHFDINNLKIANDKYGHLAGDDLIRNVAKLIFVSFQGIGECYRYGGDEFTVILRSNVEEAIKIGLENYERNKNALNFNKTLPLPISVAYGYAIYNPAIDRNLLDTLNRADESMYKRKQAMKNE